MKDVIELDRYPVDQPGSPAYRELLSTCQRNMADHGMFNLDGFVRPEAIARAAAEVQPLARTISYTHQRNHNVYFDNAIWDMHPPILLQMICICNLY